MKDIIQILDKKKALSTDLARTVLTDILSGKYKEDEIENFLISFESKPYHCDELVGFIQAMKAQCVPIKPALKNPIIDVCGTGGSGKNRFNISTASVFVLAAAGLHVAKHGNYGSKRPNGSFNFLEEMNIPFQFEVHDIKTLLKQSKCCFLLARYFHIGMKHVVRVRKKIEKPTIFNYIGPLANPVDLDYQLIGLSSDKNLSVLIDTIKVLPLKKVVLCIGGDGRDEVSLAGKTQLISIGKEGVKEFEFDFVHEIEAIQHNYKCGDSHENALIFTNIFLDKNWDHPIIKHICINTAAALYCAGDVSNLIEGYEKSCKLFKSEAVINAISCYKEIAAELQ